MIALYNNPQEDKWPSLTKRPADHSNAVNLSVKDILSAVRTEGDAAVIKYTSKFDKVELSSIELSMKEIQNLASQVPPELKSAINTAYDNITRFHNEQVLDKGLIETTKGVSCWREARAIDNVGLYIPGGSAPLFSTVLMLGVPAQLAGCKNIMVSTPPNADGQINPAIAYCALKVGAKTLYRMGGAQAIAALTFGTESILKADKIFGPGNQFVTEAKMQALQFGVSIDMPAGPSEVLVIADQYADASFIAADLLSQLEHGVDSQAILCTTSKQLAKQVVSQITDQLNDLPRKGTILKSLSSSKIIVFDDLDTCFEFSNTYAPEHLIVNVINADNYTSLIQSAGSVFIGSYSCESIGDYASGTNHTLPTSGYATSYSGVSLDSFVKKITFQNVSRQGLVNIGPVVEVMAEAEGLRAHKNAVSIRLKSLVNG